MKYLWIIAALLTCGVLYAEQTTVNAAPSAEMKEKMKQQKREEVRQDIQKERTQKREEALERVNKRLAELEEKQQHLNERHAKLLEMKRWLESAPVGSTVVMEDVMGGGDMPARKAPKPAGAPHVE